MHTEDEIVLKSILGLDQETQSGLSDFLQTIPELAKTESLKYKGQIDRFWIFCNVGHRYFIFFIHYSGMKLKSVSIEESTPEIIQQSVKDWQKQIKDHD